MRNEMTNEFEPHSDPQQKAIRRKMNHRLYSLKLRSYERSRQEDLDKAIAAARERNGGNRNDLAFSYEWIAAHIAHASGLLDDHYKVACEIWDNRGEPKTALFIRAFFGQDVLRFLKGRHSRIEQEFIRLFQTIPGRLESDVLVKNGRKKLRDGLVEVKTIWWERTEAEAEEIQEHQSALRTIPGNCAVLLRADRLFRRTRDWEPQLRTIAIAEIKRRLETKATQLRICKGLDTLELPVLEEWSDRGVDCWTKAFHSEDYKGRVKKMISDARYKVTSDGYLVTGE